MLTIIGLMMVESFLTHMLMLISMMIILIKGDDGRVVHDDRNDVFALLLMIGMLMVVSMMIIGMMIVVSLMMIETMMMMMMVVSLTMI